MKKQCHWTSDHWPIAHICRIPLLNIKLFRFANPIKRSNAICWSINLAEQIQHFLVCWIFVNLFFQLSVMLIIVLGFYCVFMWQISWRNLFTSVRINQNWLRIQRARLFWCARNDEDIGVRSVGKSTKCAPAFLSRIIKTDHNNNLLTDIDKWWIW